MSHEARLIWYLEGDIEKRDRQIAQAYGELADAHRTMADLRRRLSDAEEAIGELRAMNERARKTGA